MSKGIAYGAWAWLETGIYFGWQQALASAIRPKQSLAQPKQFGGTAKALSKALRRRSTWAWLGRNSDLTIL